MKAAGDAASAIAKVSDARLWSHQAPPVHGMTNKAIVPEWSIWIIAGLALVAAIWLPFGFALGGLIEEWTELGLFAIHGPIFLVDEAGAAGNVSRPSAHLCSASSRLLPGS
ncbi:hypothetical protein [Bradyrhizobium sp. USDA 10063]